MKTIAKRPARTANTSSRLVLGLLLGASAWALSAPAMAQPALSSNTSDVRVQYDIPAQPLAAALVEYARQSDLRVLYPAERLSGLNAMALHGAYTRDQALALLLSRSGVSAGIVGDTIQIDERTLPQRQSVSGADAATRATEEDSDATATHAEDLVVTGTRIRGAVPAGANVITLDRDAIEQSGRTNIQDVLQTMPQVFPGSQGELTQLNSTAPGSNIALGSSVDLRGLGSDATLTLLNGRRLAPAGFGNFVDISAIPLAAIERIEVLADGASATYGADAVGGVVNILLRRDVEHPETTLRYSLAEGFDEWDVSHVLGETWRGGSIVAGYEYRQRDALAAADRDYAASSDLTRFGGTDFRRFTASPGNIIYVGGAPTVLGIPTGQDGLALTEADLIDGAYNLQNGNEGAHLLPEQESHALFASARQELTPNLAIFFDILASRREAHAEKAQLGGVVAVPETNYYRQQNGLFAGEGDIYVAYFFGNDFGPLQTDTRSDTITSALGAAFEFADDWRLEASLAYGWHVDDVENGNIADSSALAPALASSNVATAFNPFGDGGDNPSSILSALTMGQHIENESRMTTFALRADGGVFDLPGGRARLAIGVERRDESFSIDRVETYGTGLVANPFTQAPGERTTDAIYAEAFLPLLSNVSLSLSARREDSSDYGDAITPKIGLQIEPWSDLTLRATWGTSFRAPQFAQLLGGTGITIGAIPGFYDPNATNGSTGTLQVLGANPSPEPEEAETWTAGFEWAPAEIEGLRVSATYFDVDFSNRIAIPGFILDAFQDPSQYAGYFIASPTQAQIDYYLSLTSDVSGVIPPDGIEVIWDERLTNLSALRVRGVDLSASFTRATSLGDLSIFATASGLLEFSRRNSPTLPAAELLDTMLNPIDWRARLGVSLDSEAWRGSLALQYADGYRDTFSTPEREIDAWVTYDARLTRRFGEARTTELSLDIRNLADEDPPFANNPIGMGFDTLNASPVGRVVAIELRRQW